MTKKSAYTRTGTYDKNRRELLAGDRIRILTPGRPEYEVVWIAPRFLLQYTGGGPDSQEARKHFWDPAMNALGMIETL